MDVSQLPPVLKAMMGDIPDNFTVSDAEYETWKAWYETLQDYEKVERLLGAISQYLTSPCKASASVMAAAIICTHRWVDDKEMENF